MKKGERKCKRCGRIISRFAKKNYAQKITVRNYKKANHSDSYFINNMVYYTTMLVCQQCADDIKKLDGEFGYEIPKEYLVKRKTT